MSTMMNKEIVATDKAPGAIGPYSQAVKAGNLVFVSGQLALDPASGELVTGDIQKEARQALRNLEQILIAAASSLDKVVKTTLFITDMDDFPAVNEVYAEFFPADSPARACVQVSRLPKNANFEVEAVALLTQRSVHLMLDPTAVKRACGFGLQVTWPLQ